jgi:hypothetical protein
VIDRAPHGVIRALDRPGDLGWVMMAKAESYSAEFGWDATFEALVGRIVADYVADYAAAHDPAREAAWIAEIDGRRAGCVFYVSVDEITAQLRLLLVDPAVRGRVWAPVWWAPAWTSRAPPAIAGSRCGPTTSWSRRGVSTRRRDSRSSARNGTTASVDTWSGRTGHWTCRG